MTASPPEAPRLLHCLPHPHSQVSHAFLLISHFSRARLPRCTRALAPPLPPLLTHRSSFHFFLIHCAVVPQKNESSDFLPLLASIIHVCLTHSFLPSSQHARTHARTHVPFFFVVFLLYFFTTQFLPLPLSPCENNMLHSVACSPPSVHHMCLGPGGGGVCAPVCARVLLRVCMRLHVNRWQAYGTTAALRHRRPL